MHRNFFIALMLMLGICSAFTPASAQERIGRAAVVRNDVSQIAPRVIRISTGDEIFRDETVRTATDSDAKFVLRDDTNLSLGPGSTLKLDRAVFSGETSAGDIAVKLTSGAFRFITGHSTKESYKIVTPLATIGVRGTTLDFLDSARPQRRRAAGRTGTRMRRPASASIFLIRATPPSSLRPAARFRSPVSPRRPGHLPAACAANAALCSQTTFAQATIPGTPEIDVDFASALCGK